MDTEYQAAQGDDQHTEQERDTAQRLHPTRRAATPEDEAEREGEAGRAERVPAGETVAALRDAEEGNWPCALNEVLDEQRQNAVPTYCAEKEERIEPTVQEMPSGERDADHDDPHLRSNQPDIVTDGDWPRRGAIVHRAQDALVSRQRRGFMDFLGKHDERHREEQTNEHQRGEDWRKQCMAKP